MGKKCQIINKCPHPLFGKSEYVVKNENNTKVQLANQNQIRCNVIILKNKEKIQVRSVKNLEAFE